MNLMCVHLSFQSVLQHVFLFSSLPPQRAAVTLREHFQKFATSRRVPVCVGPASMELAVTHAVEVTVTPSLAARHVPPASSPWMPKDRTSASLWRDSPADYLLVLSVMGILDLVSAFLSPA